MSTSVNPSRSRPGPARWPLPRPRLTVVPRSARRAPRVPFLLLVVTMLAAGLVGLLLLNTSMERGAYQVTALRQQSADLAIRQQTLELQVAALREPQQVAQEALRLGMVQDLNPAFLTIGSGQVLGHSVPGHAGDQVDVGATVGPSIDRLAKIAPVVGGADASASTGLVHLPAAGHATKGGDTGPTSPTGGH